MVFVLVFLIRGGWGVVDVIGLQVSGAFLWGAADVRIVGHDLRGLFILAVIFNKSLLLGIFHDLIVTLLVYLSFIIIIYL